MLGLKQEVVSDVKSLWSFLAELEALLVLGMCLLCSQVVPCTEAALLGALDPPEPARAFLLDATAPVSAPGCEHVGVCGSELRQPFLHKERPRTPEPSLDGPGQQCLGGNRPAPARPPPHPLSSLPRGAVPVLLSSCFFSLTVLSPFGVGGEEPDAEALCPGVAHQSSPGDHPRASLPQRLTAKQPAICHTSLHSASPRSTTAHPFPACCLHGEGALPSSLSQAPSHRPEPFTHGAPASQPPGRRLIGRK